MKSDWPGNAELIILDKIHKYKKWKSFVKGEYDTLKDKYRFLVTIDKKPWFSVEVKLNDVDVSPHLHYFKNKLNIPYSYQVVKKAALTGL